MNDPEIRFKFDGRRYRARKGDTIAGALYGSGVKVLTRSIKFHRPRGLHCGTGECPNCLVNVNGVPNVRSCITLVSEGMVVRSQNRIVSLRFDPLVLMDHLFKRGFNYHHKFIRPAFAKGIYQGVIRRMAGIGEVPSVDITAKPTGRAKADVLIIGSGRVASHAAERFISAGARDTIVVNSTAEPGDEDPLSPSAKVKSMAVGAFDDGDILVSDGMNLQIIEPRFVILAEEGGEQSRAFPNWDLPGILQETAAKRLIEDRITIGRRIVITGEAARCERLADQLRTSGLEIEEVTIVEPGSKVLAAHGRNRVRKITTTDGKLKRTVLCDCIVTCGPMNPRTDIARQLGCEVEIKGRAAPKIKVNESFETLRKDVFAVGGSVGILNESEANGSAEIAVNRIVSRMKEAGTWSR